MNAHDDGDDGDTESFPPLPATETRPSSPPPSFHSRSSSPSSRRLLHDDPVRNEADQTLADTFGDDDESDDDEEPDARQRLMRANPEPQTQPGNGIVDASSSESAAQDGQRGPSPQRRDTLLPFFATPTASGRVVGGIHHTNDGVFANLNAKPERGEKNEDLPPVSNHFRFVFWPEDSVY